MTIEYADLSRQGLAYHPRQPAATGGPYLDGIVEYLDSDRDIPEIVGTIPNLAEFAVGVDHNVGAFEIKAQDSRVVTLPANLEFLLPTTGLIMDDLYAAAGPKAADQAQVSLQFFRRDYRRSERLLFDQIHRHASEGKMVIYVATAVDAGERGDPQALGTEYYSEAVIGREIGRPRRAASAAEFRRQYIERGVTAAPGGAIVRFGETTLHAAPDVTQPAATTRALYAGRGALRRSLINIIASYKLPDGTVYGRTRPPNDHRPSPVTA